MGQFTLSFDAFRFYEEGTQNGSVVLAGENANIEFDFSADFNFQLRVRLQESGGKAGASSDDYRLQYSKNGGTWTNITTTSSNVKAHNSGDLTDGGATTQRLSAGNGSFVAGKISETGEVVDHQLTANNHTEHLYSLTLVNANIALDDVIEFRVLHNASTITYGVVPKFTRSNLPPGQPVLYTEDQKEFSTSKPSFEFSAEDPEGDDITYQVQIFKQGAEDYFYLGGQDYSPKGGVTVLKVRVSDRAVVDYSGAIFEDIYSLGHDDTHIFVGTNYSSHTEVGRNTLKKLDKSDLSLDSMTDIYAGAIRCLCVDDNYVYIGGGNVGRVYKLDKATLEYVGQSSSSTSNDIRTMTQDADFLYSGDYLGGVVWKIRKSDMQVVNTYNHGSTIDSIAADTDFVYSGASGSIRKLSKSNLALQATNSDESVRCLALAVDDDFVYAGWRNGSMVFRVLDKTDMSVAANGPTNSSGWYTYTIMPHGDYIYFTAWDMYGNARRLYRALKSTPTSYTGTTWQMVTFDKVLDLAPIEWIIDAKSETDQGFENVDTPSDTNPFNSGDKIKYTVQDADALAEGEYRWRVRGRDPNA